MKASVGIAKTNTRVISKPITDDLAAEFSVNAG